MSISPISNVSAIYGAQQTQNQGVAKQKSGSTQPPADTVQLSAAAQAHLSGAGDADHDGDSH
jgi:hypothetical protein